MLPQLIVNSDLELSGVERGVSVHAQLLQLCLTLCDPMDCSPTGSFVHGILQARTLEWVGNQSFGSLWNLLRAPTQCSGTGTFCQVCTLAPGHLLSSRDGAFGSHLEHPQLWWKRRLHSWVARVWVRDPGPQCVALPSAEQSLVPGYRALYLFQS